MFHHIVEIQYKRGDRSAMHRRMKTSVEPSKRPSPAR